MSGKILQEIQQTKPLGSLEQEAFLNIVRTADVLLQNVTSDVLRPYGLSITQYNVLRILRGAGETGLTCKAIGSRLITRDPDITRLLDRLEKRRLVTRSRAREDRRFVAITITLDGLEMLNQLDAPLQQMHVISFAHMDQDSLRTLIGLLEKIREPHAGAADEASA